jgi:hypothetical protein
LRVSVREYCHWFDVVLKMNPMITCTRRGQSTWLLKNILKGMQQLLYNGLLLLSNRIQWLKEINSKHHIKIVQRQGICVVGENFLTILDVNITK